MKIFEKLNTIRAYQRAHLQFLESLEDYDIVCEIGAAQEAGKFMTAKQLLLCDLGAPATLRRRLERMVKMGIITMRSSLRRKVAGAPRSQSSSCLAVMNLPASWAAPIS